MQNRRDFLKTAAFAAIGSGLSLQGAFAGEKAPVSFAINQLGLGAKMKLRFFPYELKLKHVFTVATYSRTTTPDVQVEIEYDGVIGYGEASMPPYLGQTVDSVMGFLKKVDLEQFDDPFRLEDILAYVDGLTPGDTAAKAAIDIALHDLVGKLLGAPWYRIWGLDKAKAPSTTFTIGIDTPEVVREKTLEVAGQFNILKVKLGRENDKQMIETIRSVSDLPIAVDANQGWTDKKYALDMIQWLKEKGIVMIEQPMPKTQLDDIAWVTQHSPLPVFADESLQRLSDVAGLKGFYRNKYQTDEVHRYAGSLEDGDVGACIGNESDGRLYDGNFVCGLCRRTILSGRRLCRSGRKPADSERPLQRDGSCKGKITLNDLPGIGVVKI